MYGIWNNIKRHIKNYEESNCKTNIYQQLIKECQAIENLIKGYRELEENINGYQEEIIYQSKTIMELEDQIYYYASEIKEIADELEEEGFTEYANEINNTCILQDEFYGGKIK